MGLVHSGTGTQWVWCTVGLGHNGSGGLGHNGSGAQWDWDTVALEQSGPIP